MVAALDPILPRRSEESSDRSFGLVFAGVFTAIGCRPLLVPEAPRWWALGAALAFACAAAFRPDILHPLNRIWRAVGRLLHRLTSPLIMGAVFFLCVTPVGWIMRRRNDVLSLAFRPDLSSYWIEHGEPSPPESMKRQF